PSPVAVTLNLAGWPAVTVRLVGWVVMVGGATNLNLSAVPVADVPAGVVTVTSTDWPALPAGSGALICVADTTGQAGAGVLPNSTWVAPVKLVPVIVTVAPPAAGPLAGDTLPTVGADGFGLGSVTVMGLDQALV